MTTAGGRGSASTVSTVRLRSFNPKGVLADDPTAELAWFDFDSVTNEPGYPGRTHASGVEADCVLQSRDGAACHPQGSGPDSGGAATLCFISFFSAPTILRADGSARTISGLALGSMKS